MTDDPRRLIRAPHHIKEMNDGFLAQRERGELPFDLPVLTVPGRRSGTPRHTPLTVYATGGQRFVVGGFPAADWIANVRATGGHATLSTGHDAEPEAVVLVELGPEQARPVLEAWPEVTPDGVGIMVENGVVAEPTPAALGELTGVCPVFRIDPAVDPAVDPA
ncbi:nitroreductase/quinone reductase family protein [Pseudonocardia spirodelae]|uniref:Nitroreductase/quinone reductase family protein n=1 Tax=Pseudonocardia spirodelae TaxID=3133431 RepID=A0ABU8T853_9PSEU